jgi:hypothetical protein
MRAHRGRGDQVVGASTTDRGGTPGKQTLVETVQRRAAAATGAPAATGAAPASSTGGAALPDGVQGKMERAFDTSFAQVRVHEGGEAQAVGAEAYTQGNDLHFAPGQYAPGTDRGQQLIGHELAHVVQQREGRVATNTQFKGVAGNDDAGLEREADELGAQAARGEVVRHSGVGGEAAGPVQRQVVQRNRNISETTDTGNQYKQELALDKTNKHVQIQLGIKWVRKGTWASDEAYETWRRWVKDSVYGYLDNKFKVELTPPAGTKFQVTIDFLLWDDDSGYEIQCWGNTHGRGAMSTGGGNLYELGQANEAKMPAVYAAHEFGHALLGVSDEYANAAVPDRKISNDHSIMGDFYSQGEAQAEYKVRHFQNIAREVAKDYPGHSARIVPA